MSSISLASFSGFQPSKTVINEIHGRFYNTNDFVPVPNWQYLTNATLNLATDACPSLNCAVSNTQNSSTLSFNQTTGLFYLPKNGRYTFNICTQYVNGCNVANGIGYEWRLVAVSTPGWPAANSTAKSYNTTPVSGSTTGSANALISQPAAQLATTSFININESGLSYSGIFPAGTYVAPLLYGGTTTSVQGSYVSTSNAGTALHFIAGSIYIEVKLDYTLV